ncbi:FadR family transcriptional regulator, partial [Corallococcus exiguus]|uniref:FadR/GntR family transcriptional regulator n=1 Tax=Corallococcus exiguus TaxID=83462 RepID=UPI0014728B9B
MTEAAEIYRFDGDARSRIKLSDAVLHRLTDLILERALKPGDSLPSESELARSFDVSKPVIREALRQLAVMGVV